MMGRKILYGKIGRSMPLTLAKCGTLGGDIEMTATLTALAKAYPEDEIILIGRNTGENPQDVGLPANVTNPWTDWAPRLRSYLNSAGLNHPNLSVEEHRRALHFIMSMTRHTFLYADAMIMWVGQHGTSNSPIPKVDDRSVLTKPQDAFTYYSGFLLRGINLWRDVDPIRREPIFLNADPRNYLKMRDMKWPLRHPVLTQFQFNHRIKHERYGDRSHYDKFFKPDHTVFDEDSWDLGHVWRSQVDNVYSRLELNALLPGTPSGDLLTYDENWENRKSFGVVINEARATGIQYAKSRLAAMREWIMPLHPSFVFGTWSKDATAALQREFGSFNPTPLPWDEYASVMHRVRCTFTTPSSGSGWATTKPWEAFGLGVVCFFHPEYDTQNNILIDAHPTLRWWLRVNSPNELRDRVLHLSTPAGRKDWENIITLQREHFEVNVGSTGRTPDFLQMIDDRLNGAK
jgi:hypothetical protein